MNSTKIVNHFTRHALVVASLVSLLLALGLSAGVQKAWADDFNAQVVSAKWVANKTVEIEFDQPVSLAEDAHLKILIHSLLDKGLESGDTVEANGKTVTIRFQSFSSVNVYSIEFKAGALLNAQSVSNASSVIASEFEDWSKVVTKVTYTPMLLSSSGGQVTAQLEGVDLNSNGWIAAYLYDGDTQVRKLDVNKEYSWESQTFTFAIPANTGSDAKEYHLKFVKSNFDDTPVPVVEGANDVVTVEGLPVAQDPQVDEITYSATELKAAGGTVTVTLKGKALSQLKTSDLALTCNGSDADIPITYTATVDSQATASFTLPENTSETTPMVYTFAIGKGADGVVGNPQAITVKPINTQALVESIEYIDQGLYPYHYGMGDYVLYSGAGTVNVNVAGENMDKLATTDFILEVKDGDTFTAVESKITLGDVSGSMRQIQFTVPENTDILAAKTYRFTVKRAEDSVANKAQLFTVERLHEKMDDTLFRIGAPNWGASLADKGLVRIWIAEPEDVQLNSGFSDGTLDAKDYIFFSDANDAPYGETRKLTEDDSVYMQDGALYISLADKEASLPYYIVFKGNALVSGEKKLATYDEFDKLYHKRYINEGAHLDSIAYDQITYTKEGGHVHAVLSGTQLNLSQPAIWGKVFADSEKDYSTDIVPEIVVSEDGTSATVDFDVPANNTDRTKSYRFIPVVDDMNWAPTYLRGYDVVSVLPEGGKTGDVTLASIELTGDGDLDDRLDVLSTST